MITIQKSLTELRNILNSCPQLLKGSSRNIPQSLLAIAETDQKFKRRDKEIDAQIGLHPTRKKFLKQAHQLYQNHVPVLIEHAHKLFNAYHSQPETVTSLTVQIEVAIKKARQDLASFSSPSFSYHPLKEAALQTTKLTQLLNQTAESCQSHLKQVHSDSQKKHTEYKEKLVLLEKVVKNAQEIETLARTSLGLNIAEASPQTLALSETALLNFPDAPLHFPSTVPRYKPPKNPKKKPPSLTPSTKRKDTSSPSPSSPPTPSAKKKTLSFTPFPKRKHASPPVLSPPSTPSTPQPLLFSQSSLSSSYRPQTPLSPISSHPTSPISSTSSLSATSSTSSHPPNLSTSQTSRKSWKSFFSFFPVNRHGRSNFQRKHILESS